MPPEGDAHRFDDIRNQRQETNQGGQQIIREPGRVIVRENNQVFIVHDETERFREVGRNARTERQGANTVTIVDDPRGPGQIVTVVDPNGALLRRSRRFPDGRDVVIIDNTFAGPPPAFGRDIIDLPPPEIRIPRDEYIVDANRADRDLIYRTLIAAPLGPIERRYTLDQVRYSPALRARMRSVDLDSITFESGSWDVAPDQAGRLGVIADAVNEAIRRNPAELFLIEGHTDAVGSDIDNLSLSDRRAQSVATVLTQSFGVPPENLTTQGYGEEYLKVNTPGPSRENRRVTVRRITPLIGQGGPPR